MDEIEELNTKFATLTYTLPQACMVRYVESHHISDYN